MSKIEKKVKKEMMTWDDALAAFRRLQRARGLSLTIVLILGLAISIGAGAFSVAYGMLWKPLPYPAQDRLAHLTLRSVTMGIDLDWSVPYLHAATQDNRDVQIVAGYRYKEFTLQDASGRSAEEVEAVLAEPALFSMLGATVLHGRLLSSHDASAGAERVAMISHELWRTRFGGVEAAVGSIITLGDKDFRVVGVSSPEFRFPEPEVALWLPMEFSPSERAIDSAGSFGNLDAVALLAPGVDQARASGEMDRRMRVDPALRGIADQVDLRATASPLRSLWIEDRDTSIRSVLLAAALVFLVTLANVCNLFMLQMLKSRQEFALLETFGATAATRARQVICETLLLATGAAVVGAALTPLIILALERFDVLPSDLPGRIGVDAATVALMIAVWGASVITLSVSGLSQLNGNVFEVLRQSGSGQTSSRATQGVRKALVVVQLAATCVLLFGTFLLVRSANNVLSQDVGFERSGQLVGKLEPTPGTVSDDETLRAQVAALLDSLRAAPSVQAAALATSSPFGDTVTVEAYRSQNAGDQGESTPPSAYVNYVSADYFQALGLPLRHGESFTDSEAFSGAPVAVIDEALAARLFGEGDVVGQTLSVRDGATGEFLDATVKGVAGIARQRSMTEPDEYPSIYLPEATPYNVHGMPSNSVELVVRTSDPERVATLIAEQREAFAPKLRVTGLNSMDSRIEETILEQVQLNRLLTLLAVVALTLSGIGLYGVLGHVVLARRREFGIRQALGASARRVGFDVFTQSGRVLLVALGIGLPFALLLGASLSQRLFGVSPFDVLSIGVVIGLLVFLQVLATALPAYSATRIKPMDALRSE